MITAVKLVDGTDEFLFQDPSFGNRDDVVWTKLDVGSPEIRTSVVTRAAADGVYDRTRWHGARSVSIECRLADAPAAKVDALTRFLHPRKRPYLVVTDDSWAPESRRLQLRSNQWTTQELSNTSSWFRDVQVQWTAPDGVWEGFESHEYTVSLDIGQWGRKYKLKSPRSYPSTGGAGLITFENPGSGESDWTAKLWGPCVGPRLTNDSTGDSLVFTSALSLSATEYIEVSSRDMTVYANGNESLSRLQYLDFANSTWWRVPSGTMSLRYNPTSGVDNGCHADFSFRPTWI